MTLSRRGFVLVHGAWHNSQTWREIKPRLEGAGHLVVAVDLPGAEPGAGNPACAQFLPVDPERFATEPSPVASISQAQRNEVVINCVNDVARRTNGPVILVGHSMGGLTISPVAEEIPDKIAAVVYLAAYMLKPNALLDEVIDENSKTGPLLCADPAIVGAFRLNAMPESQEYRRAIVEAFYGDLNEAQIDLAISNLHCDEPVGITSELSPVTANRFGVLPRHYIRCLHDAAISVATQDMMIDIMDTHMPSPTRIHSMTSSHSPFFSQPDVLAKTLLEIAAL